MEFDPKEWAHSKTGQKAGRSRLDAVDGLYEAVEVIMKEILAGRSSATYEVMRREVAGDVFGIHIEAAAFRNWVIKHWGGIYAKKEKD